MGFFYTNLYLNEVRDKIEWYSDNSYENFDVVTFANADRAKSYGLEYFFMIMGQTIGGGFWYNDLQDGSDDSELNGINKGLNMYGKVNLPEKYIFYPAMYLPHKNHKYILEAALILKQKQIDEYCFVFCGNDKGSLHKIESAILSLELKKQVKILKSLSDEQLISIYLNSFTVCMPTTGGPTNLPIYEAFYFKKPIFYSDNLLAKNDQLNDLIIPINLDDPNDLAQKLENFSINNEKKKLKEHLNFIKKFAHPKDINKNIILL